MAEDEPRRTDFFAALPPEVTGRLLERASPVRIGASQTLFVAGDPGDGCYIIDEGLLKVELAAGAGVNCILALLRPGAVVGELSLIDGRPRSASVSALRPSKLRFVSRAVFEDLVAGDLATMKTVAAMLATRLRDTNLALARSNVMPVKARVAVAMVALAESFGQSVGPGRILIKVKLSQGDIAAMAGVSREMASRILNDWLRRGEVSRQAGYYCIEKAEAINRAAESG